MNKTNYFSYRQHGYEKVLNELRENPTAHTPFENSIKERIFRWWANWKPDYEGWLTCADALYAKSCVIDAIGSEPQIYKDYRAAMKYQRDSFEMDMGPIETCVVDGETIAFNYKMYMTAKSDMGQLKKDETVVLKVSEFNTFAPSEPGQDPMVVHLQLIASGLNL